MRKSPQWKQTAAIAAVVTSALVVTIVIIYASILLSSSVLYPPASPSLTLPSLITNSKQCQLHFTAQTAQTNVLQTFSLNDVNNLNDIPLIFNTTYMKDIPLRPNILQKLYSHDSIALPKPLTPKQIIDCHFSSQLKTYPNVLTVNPKIDCYHGRYLLYTQWLTDGFGSTMCILQNILAQCIIYNLTLIRLPLSFDINHEQLDSNQDKINWSGMELFDIPKIDYDTCPDDSPIKQNIIKVNMLGEGWKYTIKPETYHFSDSHKQLIKDLNNLPTNDTGCTVLSISANSYWGNTLLWTGFISEIRFFAVHPELPLLTGRLPNSYYSIHYPQQTNYIDHYPTTSSIMVAIHARRGDTIQAKCCDADGHINIGVDIGWYRSEHRVTADSSYLNLLKQMHNTMSENAKKRMHYTLYSEGDIDYFRSFRHEFKNFMGFELNIILNGPTTVIYDHLARADILVVARSSFSGTAASYNSISLKILATNEERHAMTRNFIDSKYIFHDPTVRQGFVSMKDLHEDWIILNETDWFVRVDELIRDRDEFNVWSIQPLTLADKLAYRYDDNVYPHYKVSYNTELWKE